jgi:hypothetical protein
LQGVVRSSTFLFIVGCTSIQLLRVLHVQTESQENVSGWPTQAPRRAVTSRSARARRPCPAVPPYLDTRATLSPSQHSSLRPEAAHTPRSPEVRAARLPAPQNSHRRTSLLLPAAVPAVLTLPPLPLSRSHCPRVTYKGRCSFPDAPTPRCAELPAVAMPVPPRPGQRRHIQFPPRSPPLEHARVTVSAYQRFPSNL